VACDDGKVTESIEQQVGKVVDEAIARRDPALPRWASARVTRLLRELGPDERREVLDRVCDRRDMPAALAADVRAAGDRAAAPAPPPPPPPPPPPQAAARPSTAVRRTSSSPARPRSRTGTVRARTFKTRTLDDVPAGTLVEYQGRIGVVEPPWLVLEDGRKFQFLNPAAVYVNGGIEVNGWDVWKVADGRSMAECHDTGDWPPVE
jgi:hypothetical protein